MTSNKDDKRGQGTTLLPCPLNHEGDRTAAHRQFGIPTNYVICLGCNLSTKGYSTPEIAAEHWNRRHPSGVASVAQDRDGVLESARITATNATVDRAINAIKELATLNLVTVLDALAKLKLGDEHPLASLFGKYADDPMWEDFLKAIEEGRAIEDEGESDG